MELFLIDVGGKPNSSSDCSLKTKKEILSKCEEKIGQLYRHRIAGPGSFIPDLVTNRAPAYANKSPLVKYQPRLEYNSRPRSNIWHCPGVSVPDLKSYQRLPSPVKKVSPHAKFEEKELSSKAGHTRNSSVSFGSHLPGRVALNPGPFCSTQMTSDLPISESMNAPFGQSAEHTLTSMSSYNTPQPQVPTMQMTQPPPTYPFSHEEQMKMNPANYSNDLICQSYTPGYSTSYPEPMQYQQLTYDVNLGYPPTQIENHQLVQYPVGHQPAGPPSLYMNNNLNYPNNISNSYPMTPDYSMGHGNNQGYMQPQSYNSEEQYNDSSAKAVQYPLKPTQNYNLISLTGRGSNLRIKPPPRSYLSQERSRIVVDCMDNISLTEQKQVQKVEEEILLDIPLDLDLEMVKKLITYKGSDIRRSQIADARSKIIIGQIKEDPKKYGDAFVMRAGILFKKDNDYYKIFSTLSKEEDMLRALHETFHKKNQRQLEKIYRKILTFIPTIRKKINDAFYRCTTCGEDKHFEVDYNHISEASENDSDLNSDVEIIDPKNIDTIDLTDEVNDPVIIPLNEQINIREEPNAYPLPTPEDLVISRSQSVEKNRSSMSQSGRSPSRGGTRNHRNNSPLGSLRRSRSRGRGRNYRRSPLNHLRSSRSRSRGKPRRNRSPQRLIRRSRSRERNRLLRGSTLRNPRSRSRERIRPGRSGSRSRDHNRTTVRSRRSRSKSRNDSIKKGRLSSERSRKRSSQRSPAREKTRNIDEHLKVVIKSEKIDEEVNISCEVTEKKSLNSTEPTSKSQTSHSENSDGSFKTTSQLIMNDNENLKQSKVTAVTDIVVDQLFDETQQLQQKCCTTENRKLDVLCANGSKQIQDIELNKTCDLTEVEKNHEKINNEWGIVNEKWTFSEEIRSVNNLMGIGDDQISTSTLDLALKQRCKDKDDQLLVPVKEGAGDDKLQGTSSGTNVEESIEPKDSCVETNNGNSSQLPLPASQSTPKIDFKTKIRNIQMANIQLKYVIDCLEGGDSESIDSSYIMKGGMLCTRCRIDNTNETRIVALEEGIEQVLAAVHTMSNAHAPQEKTIALLRKHFIPLNCDIHSSSQAVINNCQTCQKNS